MKSKLQSAAVADNDGVIDAPIPRCRSAASARRRVQLICDPSRDRTQQSFKDDCDINLIMARYLKTGQLPSSTRQPVYLDTTAYDFLAAQNLVARARGEFSLLSAEERDSYGNQVELWLDHKAALAAQAEGEGGEPPTGATKVAPGAPTRSAEASPKGEPASPSATPPAKTPAFSGEGGRPNTPS